MATHALVLLVSLGILYAGAEGLVRGSAALGLRAGLSPLAVGLTVVAFGTSAPELVVSLSAALAGQGALAMGNVVGSNSFNIGVILGLTALICPVAAQLRVVRLDAPIMLAASAALPLLVWNGRLGRLEGGALLAGLILYTWFTLRQARRAGPEAAAVAAALPVAGAVAAAKGPAPRRRPTAALGEGTLALGGLAALVVGSRLLSGSAVAIAEMAGMSEAAIGLTIVAAGTSLPELATSLVAALRRQPDIAVGNVVGSNAFNCLGIAGAAALAAPLETAGVRALDYGVMVAFSALLLPLLWTGLLLRRLEGGALLLGYAAYVWALWPK